MATNNYIIRFRTLRGSGYDLVLHIGGGSGSDIELKGAAQPFVTSEDADEDVFKPVRTQTGYIRIVDDGKAADGVTTFDWHDLIPASDTERPVTLTKGNTTLWQGFMQTQTFDGPLYSGPTEREFPVQCMLSALDSIMVDTSIVVDNVQYHVCNFYMLIYQAFSKVSSKITIGNFQIQGGTDAYVWLKSKFDWQNLLTDNGGTLSPRYSYLKALEDMCRFWGFSLRTDGTNIYLTMIGDSVVTGKLTMTLAQVLTAATTDTSTGTISSDYYSSTPIYDYANTEQQETYLRGKNKAIVKADCNKADIGVDFAPQAVEDAMGDDWRWAGESDSQVGYFYTNPPKAGTNCITTDVMNCSSIATKGQFMRVQIYGSTDDAEPVESDVIDILAPYAEGQIIASIETVRSHRFGVGSLEMTGDIYHEAKKMTFSEGKEYMVMRLGIGASRATAKWFYIKNSVTGDTDPMNPHWDNSPYDLLVFPKSGKLCVGSVIWESFIYTYIDDLRTFAKIPTEAGLEGKVFIDFLGSGNGRFQIGESFMIANFSLKFSRDTVVLPNTFISQQPARMVTVRRQSACEYKSEAWNKNTENWSADCIFASDNNMEYGLGLLMNSNGTWLEKATYSHATVQQQRPEEHLAGAVTSYWANERKMTHLEVQNTYADIIRPDQTVSGGYIAAIGYDWRDAIVKLDIIQ